MKGFLQHRSARSSYDGWAVKVVGDAKPIPDTVCTTRQECRELRREYLGGMLRSDVEVVKIRIEVTVA